MTADNMPESSRNYPQKQRFVFSEILFTENFISNHKDVPLLHVYPLFAFLRVFSFVQSVFKPQH
jgi:hypothetical protein